MTRRDLPPVWVVNLKESADRREYIEDHLGALGVRYELVEAVNGRGLSRDSLDALYSPRAAISTIGRELSLGEIGCSLSHLGLYRKMLDEGRDEVLIVEDDAIITPDAFRVLAQRDRFPRDWEIVLLGHGWGPISFWAGRRLDDRHRVVRFADSVYGTYGYMIRKSAARIFLERGYPISRPADHLTGSGIRSGVRLYGIDPPCLLTLDTLDPAQSTMPDSHAIRKKPPAIESHGRLTCLRHEVVMRTRFFYKRYNPLCLILL